MQDDPIGTKIVVLAPADMARLPPSIITKKLVVNNLVCYVAGTIHTYLVYAREIVHFLLHRYSPSSLEISKVPTYVQVA
jgi:hypothetical protein